MEEVRTIVEMMKIGKYGDREIALLDWGLDRVFTLVLESLICRNWAKGSKAGRKLGRKSG